MIRQILFSFAIAILETICSNTEIDKLLAPRQLADVAPARPAAAGASGAVKCNQEMMISYGLTGLSAPAPALHAYCPMITENCCSPEDVQTSMTMWNTEYRPRVERYYEVYLYSVKYLLGFSQEGALLAKDYANSQTSNCKKAAVDYGKMNLNPKVTSEIFKAFVLSLQKMGDVRRGFYCNMCDARLQKQLADYWAIVNIFYRDRIYYSQDFCKKLVEATIRASYYTVFYLKRYAENMAIMINCKSGNTTKLEFSIDFWTKQQVKNCYYFKNKYFFFFCERYCEKFHLVKPSDILDGNIKQLRKFVEHIKDTRKKVFYYPTNNILMDGLTYEESYLEDYFEEASKMEVFITSTMDQVKLDKFKTDVVYTGGMDPFESVDKSGYALVLARVGLFALWALALAMLAVV